MLRIMKKSRFSFNRKGKCNNFSTVTKNPLLSKYCYATIEKLLRYYRKTVTPPFLKPAWRLRLKGVNFPISLYKYL